MRRHLSVLGLWTRNRLGKVLVLLALTAVLETVLFGTQLYIRPERTVAELLRGVPLTCGAAFLGLFSLLTYCGDERKAAGYTLGRLAVSEGSALGWKGVFGFVCFLLFWAVQAAVGLGLCVWYAAAVGPAHSSAQTVLLAFYRTDFLHSLMPLAEGAGYARNLLLAAGLGLETAVSSWRMRRGGRGLMGPLLAAATALTFTQRVMGGPTRTLWLGLAALFIAGLDAMLVLTGGEEEAA